MKRSFVNIATLFTLITLVSKLLGLIRDSILANNYGASSLTDAYYTAITIPTFFYQVIGASVMTIFIPFYKEKLLREGNKEANNFANKVSTLLTLVVLFVTILIFIDPGFIVKLIVPNFKVDTYLLTTYLVRISIFNTSLMILSNISCGVLQSNKEFISTSLMGIALNIPVLVYLILFNGNNIITLTILSGLSFTLQLLIQIPFLKKINFKLRPDFRFIDKDIKKLFFAVFPIIIGLGVQQISTIVDKVMGSSLSSGSITILDFAMKINGVLYAVFATGILTITYPLIANDVIQNETTLLAERINKTITQLLMILIPICISVILFKEDLISLIYHRGNFTNDNAMKTALVLGCFVLSLPFNAVRDLIANVFYSMKDTKTPAINGAVAVLLNVLLNVYLTPILGISGIAISTSVAMMLSSLLLIIRLKSKLKEFRISDSLLDMCKMVAACVLFLITVVLIKKIFYPSGAILLIKVSIDIIIVFAGAFVYLALLYIFNLKIIKNKLTITK